MSGDEESPEAFVERKKDAAFILGVGSVGFLFLGLVAFLSGPRVPGGSTWYELMIAGAVGIGLGIYLIVALLAVWFSRTGTCS